MLTKLQAYSSWPSVEALPLDANGEEATDLIQIRNIEGLEPIKATISTSPFGSFDGAAFTGASVSTRNIVLTLSPNPDWKDYTYANLRKLLYLYFMPKSLSRLVFTSEEIISPVEISGYVEGVAGNSFSKDPEYQISIICPDPYFVTSNPRVVTGITNDGSDPFEVDYPGDVETGFKLEVFQNTAPDPTYITAQVGDVVLSTFKVVASVSSTKSFVMNSVPGDKYVRNVDLNTSAVTNLLDKVDPGYIWPTFKPGKNNFSVVTDAPLTQDWKLTYYERYGGL